jgi:hypothetical protein
MIINLYSLIILSQFKAILVKINEKSFFDILFRNEFDMRC